jgi:hypothetical protein
MYSMCTGRPVKWTKDTLEFLFRSKKWSEQIIRFLESLYLVYWALFSFRYFFTWWFFFLTVRHTRLLSPSFHIAFLCILRRICWQESNTNSVSHESYKRKEKKNRTGTQITSYYAVVSQNLHKLEDKKSWVTTIASYITQNWKDLAEKIVVRKLQEWLDFPHFSLPLTSEVVSLSSSFDVCSTFTVTSKIVCSLCELLLKRTACPPSLTSVLNRRLP